MGAARAGAMTWGRELAMLMTLRSLARSRALGRILVRRAKSTDRYTPKPAPRMTAPRTVPGQVGQNASTTPATAITTPDPVTKIFRRATRSDHLPKATAVIRTQTLYVAVRIST